MQRPVLVRVDDSPEASTAALWAMDEAVLRRAPVRLLTISDTAGRDEAWGVARSTGEWCRRGHREADIVDEVVSRFPSEELVRRSADAQLLVVGSRGRGAVAEVLLGSVSMAAAMGAHCPVVIRQRRTCFAPGLVCFLGGGGSLGLPARVHVRRPTTGQYSW
ncbi:universal stress protein [Saccharopolyspora phatthalungensis]|uniref:Nucleotide-binding universal stress UspA family protein n=1 Tax=Saccharopolyspora phatthalungensis TaxID=664693 RepID=A0A840Q8A4_9PSEU|nr:universal stress protein [Saccharopolyspora phatthalungensis]MBB5155971.1 nucleotide-binding universal stress UspA family protein [Saccharopolyspora phatthalungensis]